MRRDHADVGLVVDALKDAADVLDDVDVFDGAIAASAESFFEGLRGADMAGAGGCREQEKRAVFRSLRRQERRGISIKHACSCSGTFSRMPRASF